MDFDSLAAFPALRYDVLDPLGAESHVVVMRGTFNLVRIEGGAPRGGGPRLTHALVAAPGQRDVAVRDDHHGELNRSSVRSESDLAQHKPRCDVIVIGSAHSPTGEPVPRIDVGVRVTRSASDEQASSTGSGAREGGAPAPATLLDREIVVHGARDLLRERDGWRLTDPEPFTELPLRYEHAFGGELRVNAGDPAAERLASEYRLSDEARARHPDGRDAAPLAHVVCAWNPLGEGFLEEWYADAAEVERWPAPRIEAKDAQITAADFDRLVRGEARPGDSPALRPCGVGVIAKPWQPRIALAGTFDDRWLAERWPHMPLDFDMAYWNGAHPDLTCELLEGGEVVELRNVLPRGAPLESGRTVCRFRLPDLVAAVRFTSEYGEMGDRRAAIDTVIIDLVEMVVSVVWRASAPADPPIATATLFTTDPPQRPAAAAAQE